MTEILIVDDEKSMREFLSIMLKKEGYNVKSATNGEEASELLKENFPFAKIKGKPANVLIFPNLASANIAHKLLKELTEYEVIGPILNGMKKPAQVLTMGSAVNDIVNMIMVSVMDAQKVKK